MSKYAIGVDLGGTTVKAGIVSSGGEIINQLKMATDADKGPDIVTRQIVRAIKEIQSREKDKEIAGIGVASPGMVELDGNVVEAPPNFKDWDAYPLRDAVMKGLANDLPLVIENDANAAALAELKFGAGKGENNFLFVIWGTGVGGGIILDGKIYHGPHGGAGEFGHSSIDHDGPVCNCGNIGCIESYIGQRYLSARASEYLEDKHDSLVWKLVHGDPSKIEPKILYDAAVQNDEAAADILAGAGALLGVAISSFMNTMNFDLAVVGGGVSAAGDFIFIPMNDRIKKCVMAPLRPIARAIPAQLGNRAGILGAAGLVI
jgi:glucokinase